MDGLTDNLVDVQESPAKPKYLVLDARETLATSIARDAVTAFSFFSLAYATRDYPFWRWFSCLAFVLVLAAMVLHKLKTQRHVFHSKESLIAWARSDDE